MILFDYLIEKVEKSEMIIPHYLLACLKNDCKFTKLLSFQYVYRVLRGLTNGNVFSVPAEFSAH